MNSRILSDRAFLTAAILVTLVSLLCTRIPLFNYLGFEFSALKSLLLSLLAGLVTISSWQKSGEAGRGSVWRFSFHLLSRLLVLLVIPLAIISVNAFFIKNCSFPHGLMLFALLPLPAVVFSHALALVVAVWLKTWRRTLFVMLWVGTLLHIVVVTLSGPQIFAFNPMLGYFPGFTYDETLNVLDRLLLYRIGTLGASLVLLLLAVVAERRSAPSATDTESPQIGRSWEIPAAGALSLCLVGMWFFSDRLALSSSEGHIRDELGAVVETDHFVIVFPDTMVTGRQRDHLIQLHEFHYQEIARFLRVSPDKKITSYLYASPEQKGRLMGARGTNIAKPWLWEIHLNLADVDGVLKHELVHVMAAEFGFPFVRVGVNSGLIEGLAVAAEQVEYYEHIHKLAAMAFAVDLEPDMEGLFSLTGFMQAHPGVSYVLAGSFARFLIDRFGIQRYKLVYQFGSFETAYNRELPALLGQWRRFLARYALNDADREKARYVFKRPSIFAKECARVIANLNAETRELLGRKEYAAALASSTKSLELSNNIEATNQKALSLFRLGLYEETIRFVEEKLQDSAIAHTLLPLKLMLGDAYWAMDSIPRAKKLYQDVVLARLSMGYDEASALRQEILFGRWASTEIRTLFRAEMDDQERKGLLNRLVSASPNEPLPGFLLAREIVSREPEKAIELLEGIPRMKFDALEYHRLRRMGNLYFSLGNYQRAKISYWQALNVMTGGAQGLEIEERLKLCDWMEEKLGSRN